MACYGLAGTLNWYQSSLGHMIELERHRGEIRIYQTLDGIFNPRRGGRQPGKGYVDWARSWRSLAARAPRPDIFSSSIGSTTDDIPLRFFHNSK